MLDCVTTIYVLFMALWTLVISRFAYCLRFIG